MTPEEALEIIKDASKALSHASYCGITGERVNHGVIVEAWNPLRKLIECLDEEGNKRNRFLDRSHPEYVKASLKIVPITDDEGDK